MMNSPKLISYTSNSDRKFYNLHILCIHIGEILISKGREEKSDIHPIVWNVSLNSDMRSTVVVMETNPYLLGTI